MDFSGGGDFALVEGEVGGGSEFVFAGFGICAGGAGWGGDGDAAGAVCFCGNGGYEISDEVRAGAGCGGVVEGDGSGLAGAVEVPDAEVVFRMDGVFEIEGEG